MVTGNSISRSDRLYAVIHEDFKHAHELPSSTQPPFSVCAIFVVSNTFPRQLLRRNHLTLPRNRAPQRRMGPFVLRLHAGSQAWGPY
jgi:hypothetical protein